MDLHGGISGREMMRVLIDGVADRVVSAELAKRRLRAKLVGVRFTRCRHGRSYLARGLRQHQAAPDGEP